jgi:hypothetical protein
MKMMHDGDQFDVGEMYVTYAKFISSKSIYIFTMVEPFVYGNHITLTTLGIYRIRRNINIAGDRRVYVAIKDDYDDQELMLYGWGHTMEIWRLSPDEQLDIMATIL